MQLMLLVFAGSIVFSIGCALARTAFFERYVYEDFPELPGRLVQLDPNDAATIAALPTDDRYALYGARIAADDPRPGPLLAHPDELHGFLRGTLATGRPAQRHAATQMLAALEGHVDADALERSARYALRRAAQSGDDEGVRRATAVLDELGGG
jgi:hypothetical protein